MKNKIINNPDQWIITRKGDFVRIKDSLIFVEENLEKIREHLKKPYKGIVRFQGKTPEQISKERYDKVLEEVNFDYNKLHDWIYDDKNKEKVEIIRRNRIFLSESLEITKAIAKFVEKSAKEKWRFRFLEKSNDYFSEILINEETGQIYYLPGEISGLSMVYKQSLWIPEPKETKPKESKKQWKNRMRNRGFTRLTSEE